MAEKIAGIIGGMGPEATVDLMQRVIHFTKAKDDIDHVHCVVDNNPQVPSRIKALLEGGGVSPGPCMAEMGKKLEQWGVDFLCIPCNTAHNYYKDVCDAVSIPVLNMIELTVAAIHALYPDAKKAGILASPAVRLTKIYEEPCRRLGIEPVYATPDKEQQLLSVIKKIKTGDTSKTVYDSYHEVIADVCEQGADAFAIACTELGILHDAKYPRPVVDAADALAKAIVGIAKGTLPLPTR